MITFYDEKGNGYGAQVELTTKNAVNGERSISGTIISNNQVLSKLDRGWSFTFDGELYKIIYAKPKDEGRNISLSFDAVHQFFYDFEHSNCYQEFNGSNRFEVYIEAIFKNSGYRYVIEAEAKAIRKENFGNSSRLKMFKDIIKAAGLEFSVTGKVVRILKKVGTDLSTVVRKNFNMNELTIEKNIGNFITYKKGLGAWKDEENHDAGRYTSEYESPLARIYGRIEGEPIKDERYKDTGKLLERLKFDVENSYSISVQLSMEDLTQAGYKYTRPRAGDYIMAINETIEFREKIRIVSYESSYDVTGRLINHKVTCNDIGTVQKAITSEGSIMRSVSESKEYAEGAFEVATRALISANGKNTNYYGATKPKDEPRGTLHDGDLLYLTVGEETELYYWSGSEWLPKILKVDTSKIETLLSETRAATNKAIEQANAKANEALAKAGTIPDMPTLSEQIKAQVLNSAEFNHLTETNKLYERVIGENETDMPDKLSRLVMSSQIFQTEVGKYSTSGGPNLIRNSGYKEGLKYFSGTANRFRLGTHPFYYNGKKPIAIISNGSTNEVLYQTERFDLERNTDYVLNFRGFNNSALTSCEVFLLGRKKDETQNYTVIKHLLKPTKLSGRGVEDVSLTFNSGEIDNAYVRFDNNGSNGGQADLYIAEIDLYKGANKRPWQPAPEDSAEPIEAVRTQMTQLAGSWAVKNLKSDGDVLNSINVLANGTNRIDGRLTHITGQTVIDEAVIDGASIKSLSASKISGGEADFAKMSVINFDAKNVTSGTFTGLTFRGGLIESLDGSISINLAKNIFAFNNNAMIEFRNKNNAIYRRRNTHTGFIHMADMNYKGVEGLYASIGVTSSGDGINSNSSGRFVGARFFRMAPGLQHEAVIDQAEFYGDAILFRDDFTIPRGIDIRPDLLDKVYSINSMIADIKALWECWGHLNNVPDITHPNFTNAVKNTMRGRKIY